jgi:hypothetical protein
MFHFSKLDIWQISLSGRHNIKHISSQDVAWQRYHAAIA